MKYIVIGGVAGGATAAARIRRNTEQAEIILFEKGEYISYANCAQRTASGKRKQNNLGKRKFIYRLLGVQQHTKAIGYGRNVYERQ